MNKRIPNTARHGVIKNPVARPPRPSVPGPAMTVVKLPSPAWPENSVAPLVCRRTQSDRAGILYLGRTYCFSGEPPESYARLGTFTGFAMGGKLVGALSAFAPAGLVENPLPAGFGKCTPVKMQIQIAGRDKILPDVCDFDALADSLLLFCGGEIISIAEATMTAAGAYDLTVLRGRLGTGWSDHDGGTEIWIMPRARLTAFQHPFLSPGNSAKFKITVGKHPPADATPFQIKL